MHIRTLLTTLVFGVVTLAGCASAPPVYKPPEYLGAGFDTRAISKVAVAPALDMRIDKSEALELDKHVHIVAKQLMEQRGYTVVTYADRSLISTLQAQPTRDAIEPMVKDFMIPDGPRHVLLFGLIDAYSKMTFGSTGNAEMFGYLVDQERHEVLWSSKAVGQIGAGGLLGMSMKGWMTQSAIHMATQNLVFSIPPREKSP
jgi:hypothetical protein